MATFVAVPVPGLRADGLVAGGRPARRGGVRADHRAGARGRRAGRRLRSPPAGADRRGRRRGRGRRPAGQRGAARSAALGALRLRGAAWPPSPPCAARRSTRSSRGWWSATSSRPPRRCSSASTTWRRSPARRSPACSSRPPGLTVTYGVDVVSFAASLVVLTAMRTPPPPPDAEPPSLRTIVEGLRYAGSRQDLVGTYLVDMNAMFFGMPMALLPGDRQGLRRRRGPRDCSTRRRRRARSR